MAARRMQWLGLGAVAATVALYFAVPFGVRTVAQAGRWIPVPAVRPSAVGYFHFDDDTRLDQRYLRDAYVRVAITGEYDAAGNLQFDEDGKQAELIADLLAQGRRVVPSIRFKSADDGVKCDVVPADLDRDTPLNMRSPRSYSPTAYAFFRSVAERYRGKFPYVFIGNEPNDADFFCAGEASGTEAEVEAAAAGDYLRLLATAKKAWADTDRTAKIGDGGMQGAILGWIMIEEYLASGNTAAALEFYGKFMDEQIDLASLRKRAAKMPTKQPFLRAKALLSQNMHMLTDVANMHHFQSPASVGPMAAFLKSKAGNKPIATNGTGLKVGFAGTPEDAARQIPEKFFDFASRGISPIVWFSVDGDEGHNAGALVRDDDSLVDLNVRAYETMASFLGRPTLSIRNLSTATVGKVRVTYSGGATVDAVWPVGSGPFMPSSIARGCVVYTHLGVQRGLAEVSAADAPVYVACRIKP